MDPPFMYKMPIGTRLFRASTIAKEGRWYNLNLNDAYTYGENITEYSTIKDLNLINVMSLTFHNDFVDRLNIMYPGYNNTGFDTEKIKCLIPFGLLNQSMQQKGLNIFGANIGQNTSPFDIMSDYMGELMQGRNRISEHTLDTHLSKVLENIYGNYYDGFISPLKWPTKIHPGNGSFFPQELCFFNLGNVKEENQHKRPMTGGGKIDIIPKFKFEQNYEIYNQIIKNYEDNLKNNKIIPLWNPHTEDVIPDSATNPINKSTIQIKSIYKTRKRNRKYNK